MGRPRGTGPWGIGETPARFSRALCRPHAAPRTRCEAAGASGSRRVRPEPLRTPATVRPGPFPDFSPERFVLLFLRSRERKACASERKRCACPGPSSQAACRPLARGLRPRLHLRRPHSGQPCRARPRPLPQVSGSWPCCPQPTCPPRPRRPSRDTPSALRWAPEAPRVPSLTPHRPLRPHPGPGLCHLPHLQRPGPPSPSRPALGLQGRPRHSLSRGQVCPPVTKPATCNEGRPCRGFRTHVGRRPPGHQPGVDVGLVAPDALASLGWVLCHASVTGCTCPRTSAESPPVSRLYLSAAPSTRWGLNRCGWLNRCE